MLKDYMIIFNEKISCRIAGLKCILLVCTVLILIPGTLGTYIFILQFFFLIKLVFVMPPFKNNFFFHKFNCLYTLKKQSIYSSVILYKISPFILKK